MYTPAAGSRGCVGGSGGGAGGGYVGDVYSIFMPSRSGKTIAIRPSHTCNVGAEHVQFSWTRQTLLAPSAKRREVFGEPYVWRAASYQGREGGLRAKYPAFLGL